MDWSFFLVLKWIFGLAGLFCKQWILICFVVIEFFLYCLMVMFRNQVIILYVYSDRYNMIIGVYSFEGDNIFKLFENIGKGQYQILDGVEDNLKDLFIGKIYLFFYFNLICQVCYILLNFNFYCLVIKIY